MLTIKTEQTINSNINDVWEKLVDFPSYKHWNPFILEITGKPAMGSKLKVIIKPPGENKMTFNPEIIKFIENTELRWRGRTAGIPGILTGEHYFQLASLDKDHTKLIHGEKFTGILLPFFKKMLDTAARQGFKDMNKMLAQQCEK